MSDPQKNYANPIHGTSCEIIHAMSALNMEPMPLEKPTGQNGYLSETDHWVSHAMDHLFAADEQNRKASALLFDITRILFDLVIAIEERYNLNNEVKDAHNYDPANYANYINEIAKKENKSVRELILSLRDPK